MNKMLRNLIIMGVVLVVAILAFIFIPKLEPKPEEVVVQAEPTRNPAELIVSEKSIEDIEKVILDNNGITTVIVYDDTNDIYYIDGAEDLQVDQTSARNIFYTASYVQAEDDIADDLSNIAEYGLETPISKLTAEYKDGTKDVYLFGNTVPGSGQHYMIKEGLDKIFIVWNNYGNNALLKQADLIKVEIHEFTIEQLDMFRIHKNGEIFMEFENLQLKEQIEMSTWQLIKPYKRSVSTADEGSFYSMVEEMLSIAPNKVLDTESNLAMYGLDEPWLAIDYLSISKEELTISFGDEVDGVYPMMYSDSDIIYEIPTRYITFTSYETIDVIERLLMLVNVKHVTKIEMDGVVGNNSILLTQEDKLDAEGNVKTDAEGQPLTYANYIVEGVALTEDERDQGSWFYQSILGITIRNEAEDDYVPVNKVGYINLVLNKEPNEFTVEFYEYNDYFYAVKYYDNEVYMIVSKEDVEQIAINYESLVNRQMERP